MSSPRLLFLRTHGSCHPFSPVLAHPSLSAGPGTRWCPPSLLDLLPQPLLLCLCVQIDDFSVTISLSKSCTRSSLLVLLVSLVLCFMFLLISCPFRIYNFGEFMVLFSLLCYGIWHCLFVCVCFAVGHSIPSAYQISLCMFYLVDFNELLFSSCAIL
jgi:hypothetical protein